MTARHAELTGRPGSTTAPQRRRRGALPGVQNAAVLAALTGAWDRARGRVGRAMSSRKSGSMRHDGLAAGAVTYRRRTPIRAVDPFSRLHRSRRGRYRELSRSRNLRKFDRRSAIVQFDVSRRARNLDRHLEPTLHIAGTTTSSHGGPGERPLVDRHRPQSASQRFSFSAVMYETPTDAATAQELGAGARPRLKD